MRELSGKRYWLIGASEGLGRALAERLSAQGVEVIVSGRNAARLDDLVQALPGPASALPCDVADTGSVMAAADAAGEIDGMVFLAGVYWPMAAQDWDSSRAEAMADVNYTGALRAIGAVLPGMRARGAGHIVLTGSLSGFRGLPGAAAYGSSKAGVMYLAEALHADLRGSGLDIQLVNPGFIRTRLTEKNAFRMPFIMDPAPAADRMVAHMRSFRFTQSFPAIFAALFRGGQFLPDWLYYPIFGR
ncbi:Oxidoreductase, short-chain dehydrogenase/reductase family [Candidatus Rhodobacter oscarellae]|uniref:Oxidoreductase, short-chain dehydrogenase/reductase family n=1 Tax=Candidatus Rhodobacter oscarellae TaxID=1675527 RepID=A0A0J9EBP1_9RHOB|nr:SDR family NAD(P)-dependent oxidoreductase [Candidatus Rhodobacter lobularis]KMW60190.1 Oxidoreductase, short-chain dehydrogenase/reductase family [Candidatus Rhodobacter lobularis]